jgi:hypothetical protein
MSRSRLRLQRRPRRWSRLERGRGTGGSVGRKLCVLLPRWARRRVCRSSRANPCRLRSESSALRAPPAAPGPGQVRWSASWYRPVTPAVSARPVQALPAANAWACLSCGIRRSAVPDSSAACAEQPPMPQTRSPDAPPAGSCASSDRGRSQVPGRSWRCSYRVAATGPSALANPTGTRKPRSERHQAPQDHRPATSTPTAPTHNDVHRRRTTPPLARSADPTRRAASVPPCTLRPRRSCSCRFSRPRTR